MLVLDYCWDVVGCICVVGVVVVCFYCVVVGCIFGVFF